MDEQYNTMLVKILVETLMCGMLLLVPLIVTTVLYSIILLNIYRNGQRFLRYLALIVDPSNPKTKSGGIILSNNPEHSWLQ